MNTIIQANLNTLQKVFFLLSNLSDQILSDDSIPPYYSSVGSHIRHVLDFYDCILKSDQIFDLTARCRDLEVETNCESALKYLSILEERLLSLGDLDLKKEVTVLDDLGVGKEKINYTYSALLAQANSHAIHHYAIINYILDGLKITINDTNFGYNPTTPKSINLN
ncbi:hypothetical protein [Hanstruepera ponticola]|uniref:hypothetical protein n=1 Tax=Hanstruepera ponticola TaxID=2042995 RepID=UPI000CF115B6|nr:hypothetical protein [Hanstruepera ponticola]